MESDGAPTFPTQTPAPPPPDQEHSGAEESDTNDADTDDNSDHSEVGTAVTDSGTDDSEAESDSDEPQSGTDDGGPTFGVEGDDNLLSEAEDDIDIASDEDLDDEEYMQKFDRDVRSNFLKEFHPQAQTHNYEEVLALSKVTRADDGRIVDSLHRTLPILTKYERARILGQRAAQLNAGAQPLVQVPVGVLQGSVIAALELNAKKIPFIIRRPLPNRGSEYWRISDLELL